MMIVQTRTLSQSGVSRAKSPARLGEYKDFRFPNNYRPDAYTAAQIDKMLDEWSEVKARIRK